MSRDLNKQQLLPEKTVKIINTDVEGSCQIKYIEALKLDRSRVILGTILSVLTGFLFLLACSWSTRLTRWFFFVECPIIAATHFGAENEDQTYSINIRQEVGGRIIFKNKKLKYQYQEGADAFQAIEFDLGQMSKAEVHQNYNKGIININQQVQLYGPCKIEIPIPNVFVYVAKELTTPFYILQYLSCVLWTFEGFAILAIIMITFSITITTINYFLLMNSVKKLRKMAENKQNVKVFRPYAQNTHPLVIRSEELVPGDLLVIEPKLIIPCDCVLISGEVMLNEASLTGESVPVPKFPLDKTNQNFSFHEDKRNSLFEGTKVLLCKPHEEYVLALVVRTGFASFKGQVFRSVLYPKPQPFKFYSQGVKFMAGLAIWVLIIYFVVLPKMIELGFSDMIIAFRFGDAITWIVPPALPIFVSMCMTYSLVRLRQQGILGVDPQRALVAGEVNTVCFDKTGTLTTTSIDVYGYQLSSRAKEPYSYLEPLVMLGGSPSNKNLFIFKIFGSCHCVSLIDGELMGDSLDIEMFNFSGYQLEQTNQREIKFRVRNDQCYLDILRVLEFESSFQRMSVIVRDNQKFYIFCKGSPEKVSELAESFTLPSNLKNSLDSLTMRGLRVLGLGIREISSEEAEQLVQESTPRSKVEENLSFFGLLIMENKLKSDTSVVIEDLMRSGLDVKIISGDNGLTTVQCARECNIIDEDQPVLLVDYSQQNQALVLEEIEPTGHGNSTEDMSEHENSIDEEASSPSPQLSHSQVMKKLMEYLIASETTIKSKHLSKNLEKSSNLNGERNLNQFIGKHGFAITGKAFDYFWAQQPIDNYSESKVFFAGFDNPLKDVSHLEINDTELLRRVFISIVKKARVFARMRPEQKSQVVQQLQALGRTVAMIGDGANDCAAIKQANVGISFAQSDASYSAPFSSSSDSLICVKKVLLDGRAALANTIEVFQYYVYASVIKYVGAELLATVGESFSSIQMLFVNYVSTLPYLKAITLSGPSNTLTNMVPLDDMFRLPNQITIYFHLLCNSVGLVLNFLYWRAQPWKEIGEVNNGTYNQSGYCQTTQFICVQMYFSCTLFCIYISRPFKNPIYKHKILLPLFLALMILNIYTFFGYSGYQQFLDMKDLKIYSDTHYLRYQFLICMIICLFQILVHFFVIARYLPCTKHLMIIKRSQQQKQPPSLNQIKINKEV